MTVSFESNEEKTEVLVGLRVLQKRQHEDNAAAIWSGVRITTLEKAIACVEATPVVLR